MQKDNRSHLRLPVESTVFIEVISSGADGEDAGAAPPAVDVTARGAPSAAPPAVDVAARGAPSETPSASAGTADTSEP